MKIRSISLVLAIVAASAALAHEGHQHATGIVRERMVLMEKMGERLLAMSRQLRANKELNQIPVEARKIHDAATQIVSQFPPGSTQPPTDAKPVIWQQWADFEAKAQKLLSESEKLANMNSTDASGLRAQFRAVGFACDECHKTYRATKQ